METVERRPNPLVARKQRRILEVLALMNPNRPILVQPVRENPDDQKETRWIDYRDLPPTAEVWTRTIGLNEVVLDFDTPEWDRIHDLATRCAEVLDEVDARPLIALTGGKGVHIHFWFDPASIVLDRALAERARTAGVDVWSEARESLAHAILDSTGLSKDPDARWAPPRGKDGIIDLTKVRWRADRSGSMIRDWGCRGGRGFRKTLVGAVPEANPTDAQMRWPATDMPHIWRVPTPLAQRVVRAIEAAVDRAEVAALAEVPVMDGKTTDDVPCASRTLTEPTPRGSRHYAFLDLATTMFRLGYPVAEAEEKMRGVLALNELPASDKAMDVLREVYSGGWRTSQRASCPSPIASAACNPNACAFSRRFVFEGLN